MKVENWIQSGNDVLQRIIIEMKKEKEKASKEDRTPDLSLTKRVLYRLSY